MTKKEQIIDETLQVFAYSDNIPLKYKDLRKIIDNYLVEQKKIKKIEKIEKKKKEKENTSIKQIYQSFVNEHLKKNMGLQEVLELWQVRRNNLSI
tara:strand:- start:272 stop:556 length:285 start_codon:yes stop_codon:yes gene_type:complete